MPSVPGRVVQAAVAGRAMDQGLAPAQGGLVTGQVYSCVTSFHSPSWIPRHEGIPVGH